jgi:hypothetical protein
MTRSSGLYPEAESLGPISRPGRRPGRQAVPDPRGAMMKAPWSWLSMPPLSATALRVVLPH